MEMFWWPRHKNRIQHSFRFALLCSEPGILRFCTSWFQGGLPQHKVTSKTRVNTPESGLHKSPWLLNHLIFNKPFFLLPGKKPIRLLDRVMIIVLDALGWNQYSLNEDLKPGHWHGRCWECQHIWMNHHIASKLDFIDMDWTGDFLDFLCWAIFWEVFGCVTPPK